MCVAYGPKTWTFKYIQTSKGTGNNVNETLNVKLSDEKRND